jgi:hypothetical protein
VIGAELAAEIELHSVREAAQRGVLGDAIEDDVGKRRIAHEIERAVLGEGRDSEIERRLGMEIGEHEELAGLVLLLVELRRIERGDGLAVEEAYAGERRRGRIVRDLEVAVEQAGDRRHAVLGVDDVFEIGKGVPLQRTVVDLGQRRRHPLDAVVGAEEIAGEVVVVAAERAAVFRAGVQRVVAAAIHRDGATRGEQPALRLDVDDARGAEAVFGRERAGDQGDRVGESRAQALAEEAQPRRQRYPVDAKLDGLHFVVDVDAAGRQSVLAYARRLQKDLIERVVRAPRLPVDPLAGDRVGRGADLRLDGGAGRLEPRGFDRHLLKRVWSGARRRRFRIGGRRCGVAGLARRVGRRRLWIQHRPGEEDRSNNASRGSASPADELSPFIFPDIRDLSFTRFAWSTWQRRATCSFSSCRLADIRGRRWTP